MKNIMLELADKFDLGNEVVEEELLKSGNINDTYKVTYKKDGINETYLIQRINNYVFKKPDEIMSNIEGVTEHIRKKLISEGCDDVERMVVKLFHTRDGNSLYVGKDGSYWRVTLFIRDSICFNKGTNEVLTATGKAFGEFQAQLSDYPAETLYETIPGFHDTQNRYIGFHDAIKNDRVGRLSEVKDDVDFILSKESYASYFKDLHNRGEIPIRVTHNDTKCNNVMFDKNTHAPLAVIDLDTVMPGFAMFDFGDAVRFAANTASEDEIDISKVSLDLQKYEAFVKGFIPPMKNKLTKYELESMPWGVLIITIELALRFLEDYINGDVYFKTAFEKHNLARARCQIALAKDIENKFDVMNDILRSYL